MAVLLGKTQERLAKPHWRRNGIPFRFACLGGVICTSLSASSIFRPAEPKFLDQVVTLSGESGLLWDEDRKSWIGSLPKPLETAELTLEPLVEFLIAPSPGEELILNSSGDRIFGPAFCFASSDGSPVCCIPLSPFAFPNSPEAAKQSSAMGRFSQEQRSNWSATFSSQLNTPYWMIVFSEQARESGTSNRYSAKTAFFEIGSLLAVLFGLGLMVIPLVIALFGKWRAERARIRFWGRANK